MERKCESSKEKFDVAKSRMHPAVDMLATFEAGRLARLQESGEVFGFHFLFGQCFADCLHFVGVINGIHC